MIMKLCARCQRMIETPNTYCDNCKRIVEEQVEKSKQIMSSRYNRQRDKKYSVFYNSKAWRVLRKKYITKHYLCEECQREAKLKNKYTICLSEEVHHKDPIQTETGWIRRLDEHNFIALCHTHHNIAHGRFKKRK